MGRPGPGSRNVAAVAVLLACVSGFGFYSLTVYAAALADAFGLGAVSRGSGLFLLTTGLAGTVVGSLLGRVDVRLVLVGGTALMATGIVLLGRADTTAQLYTAYALLGLGQAGTGIIPGSTLLTRWFGPEQRPTALILAATGLSVGGIAVAPVLAAVLDGHAFASVTAGAAVAFLLVALLATATVTPHPTVAPGTLPLTAEGMLRGDVVRTHGFWSVSAGQTCAALAQVGGLTHLFALVASRGGSDLAGQAISAVALGSLSSRFVGGAVLRRVPTSTVYSGLLVVQAGALCGLALVDVGPALLALSFVFGATIGNVLLCHPLRLVELFGQRDFARVLALSSLVATGGLALGPVLVGGVRESSGNWTPAYVVAGCVSLAGAGLLRLGGQAPTAHLEPVLTPAGQELPC